jgi:hypothetical protein
MHLVSLPWPCASARATQHVKRSILSADYCMHSKAQHPGGIHHEWGDAVMSRHLSNEPFAGCSKKERKKREARITSTVT